MPVSPFNVERFAAGRTGAAVPVAPLAQPLPGATAGEYVRASGYWDQVAALGQELAQTAQQVGTAELRSQAIASDLEAAALHRQNTMRLHQLRNSAYVELADLKDRIGNSPETPPEQIENIFGTQAAAIAERYRQELPPEMANGFASDFGRDVGLMRIDLRHKATARMESSARADLQSSLDALQGVAARASPEERERITSRVDDMIGAALRTGAITPEEAHKAASRWLGGLDEALVRAAIQDDPEAAIQRIDAGEFRGLSPDQQQQLREHALLALRQRHREAAADQDVLYSTEYADLRERVALGEGTQGDIDAFRAKWSDEVMPDLIRKKVAGGWQTLQTLRRTVERAGAAEEQRVAQVDAAIASGAGYAFPLEQKDIDAWFAARQGNDQGRAALETLVQSGRLPTAAKAALAGSVMQGPSAEKVAAAARIGELEAASPMAASNLPDEVRRRAAMLSDYVAAGQTPDYADEVMTKAFAAPQVVREDRQKVATAAAPQAWRSAVSDVRSPTSRFLGMFTVRPDTDAEAAMRAQWSRLYSVEYEATGDSSFAAKRATALLGNTWGATHVDGDTRWMQYAPELVYGNAEWLRPSFEAAVKSATVVPEGDVRAVSDFRTRQDFSAGRPPTYALVSDSDNDVRALLDRNGMPLRWAPEPVGSDWEKLKAERQRQMEALQRGMQGP